MQDDIQSSKRKSGNLSPRRPMRSLRLRGYLPEAAKDRVSAAAPAESSDDAPVAVPDAAPENSAGTKAPKKQRFARWRRLSRRVRYSIMVLLLIIIGGIVYVVLGLGNKTSPGTLAPSNSTAKTVALKTVASPLTGVQVSPTAAARPVTGIMIENSDAARPQSGLQAAGVVFEAMAEGGVTRFLALFQDSAPQYIGPVRSLRPYYLDYAAGFDASIVHVGGSPDALSEVEDGNFRNLDEFYNGSYFTRITSREAPHNVYTSFAELDQLNKSKGYTSSKYMTWPRKADKPLKVPTAKTIQFAISGPDYYDNYTYSPTTDSYLRDEGGAPHMDLTSADDTTGTQLNPKVVIAIVVPVSNGALDATGAYYQDYADIGSGAAYIFQDGGETQGTWTKTGTTSQINFTNSAGQPIAFNAGQTWVTLVSAANQVTYSP